MVDINKTPGIHDIRSAAERIKGIVDRTPLLESERLNDHAGARVFLKCEMFQPVGSFKLRGAWNMISRLADSRIKNGVIAYSSGNHAQAVAWSALRRGVKATIIMPLDAPTVKVNNIKALGAKPGEETLLPVSFFISPELIENPNTENLKSITLSYTFFDTKNINVSNFN